MASSVTAVVHSLLRVTEQLAAAQTSTISGSASVRHEVPSPSAQKDLNASSTPAISKVSSDRRTLSAGADTIDLTAAPGSITEAAETTVDFTGLKVQACKFLALATNTADIRIKVGATNAYHIFGDANGEVTLGPGESCLFEFNEGLPDVGAGAKDIDVSSSDVDAIYEFVIVGG